MEGDVFLFVDDFVKAEVILIYVELADQQILFLVSPPDFKRRDDGNVFEFCRADNMASGIMGPADTFMDICVGWAVEV